MHTCADILEINTHTCILEMNTHIRMQTSWRLVHAYTCRYAGAMAHARKPALRMGSTFLILDKSHNYVTPGEGGCTKSQCHQFSPFAYGGACPPDSTSFIIELLGRSSQKDLLCPLILLAKSGWLVRVRKLATHSSAGFPQGSQLLTSRAP